MGGKSWKYLIKKGIYENCWKKQNSLEIWLRLRMVLGNIFCSVSYWIKLEDITQSKFQKLNNTKSEKVTYKAMNIFL